MAEDPRDLQRALDVVTAFCKRWRLRPSAAKSQVLVNKVGREAEGFDHLKFSLAGGDLEVVEQFTYLGVVITYDLDWSAHKETTVKKADQRWNALKSVWGNNRLSLEVKRALWASIVRPILEYGATFWGCESDISHAIDVVQHRHWRNILGCSSKTALPAIYGDLAFDRFETRVKNAIVRFLGQAILLPKSRTVAALWRNHAAQCNSYRSRLWSAVVTPHFQRAMELGWRENWLEQFQERNSKIVTMAIENAHSHVDRLEAEWWSSRVEGMKEHSMERYAKATAAQAAEPRISFEKPRRPPVYMRCGSSRASQIVFKVRSKTLPLRSLTAKIDGGSETCPLCPEVAGAAPIVETIDHMAYRCQDLAVARQEVLAMFSSYPPVNENNWLDFAAGLSREDVPPNAHPVEFSDLGRRAVCKIYARRCARVEEAKASAGSAPVTEVASAGTSTSRQARITDFFGRRTSSTVVMGPGISRAPSTMDGVNDRLDQDSDTAMPLSGNTTLSIAPA
jgi:hypothetical protein